MTARILLCLIMLIPVWCPAQHWRIEASGGIAKPSVVGERKRIPPADSNAIHGLPFINTPQGVWGSTASLKVMRRDSVIEYGLGVCVLPLKGGGAYEYHNGIDTFLVTQEVYLAKPAFPVIAFFNYYHQLRKTYAYLGLHAGVVFTSGKATRDASLLADSMDHTIYFQNSTGYIVGTQIGVRRCFGRVDAGIEVTGSWLHLALEQGISRTRYSYDILSFPMQLSIGYTF
jgi:hypothetical protein